VHCIVIICHGEIGWHRHFILHVDGGMELSFNLASEKEGEGLAFPASRIIMNRGERERMSGSA